MAEKLTREQQLAVTNRGGKLLVSAAAGSGKTKVLVDRLLSYLEDVENPANVDEFLIITYTKAAAAELRGKIAAKLTEKIAENPTNKHMHQQIQRLYLAKISTVHSFCADILREYAYRLDIPSDFRVADENECMEIQTQALDKILNDAYEAASENEDFCAFVDSQGLGRDDRMVPEIILKVYNSAKCHLNPNGWLEWCMSAGQIESVQDASETIWGKYLMEDLQQYLQLQIHAINQCILLAGDAEGMEKPVALFQHTKFQLEQLRDAQTWDQLIDRKDIDYGRLVFSKKCADSELAERMKAIRNACKKGVEKKLRAFSDSSEQVLKDLAQSCAAARGLICLSNQFSAEYEKRKKARRILDFADLEHRMLDLLLGKRRSGPTALAREIGQRYREIMVDEFQDSNQVQDAIFGALTLQRNNCFMVGDVKQSIYQFRLADPGIFIDKYNRYAPAERALPGEGRKILLNQNFRSSGGVISAVNDVFSACMSETVGGLAYGADEQLYEGIPHISLCEPEVTLCTIQVREDTYAEEAAFTADKISQLLDGSHMVRDGENLRPITADDIVILLRSPGSVGGEFSYALEQRGIRCSIGGSGDILQTEEIRVLRSILQIINNPLQDIPMVAAMASRVFCFTADDLAAIRKENRRESFYYAVKSSANPKAVQFVSTLDLLRKHARMDTLPQLLQHIFMLTKLDSIYGCMPNGDAKTENIQLFCQLASNYETTGRKDLAQFLDHLTALESKGLSAQTDQKTPGTVTIMSIHKSKGLEFPVVFLCGLSRGFNHESTKAQVLCDKDLGLGLSCVDSKNRVRYPAISKRAIAAKMSVEGISEELRVLYVAMTRPKDRLFMTYAVKNLETDLQDIALRLDVSGKQLITSQVDCPGEWVLQTAMTRAEAGALFSLGGRPDRIHVSECPWDIQVCEGFPRAGGVAVTENQPCMPAEALVEIGKGLSYQYPNAQATLIPSKQTATQLKGRVKDHEAAENTSESKGYTRRFRKPGFADASMSGKDYGNAMHAVMQYIRLDQCESVDGIHAELGRMIESGLITSEQAEAVSTEEIIRFVTSSVGRKICAGSNVLREFKFSILEEASTYFPEVAGEQILLQGVIDCALIEDDGITIVDFKTDRADQHNLQQLVRTYSSQVLAYAGALSKIYALPIKAAYLYFFRLGEFVEVYI